MLYRSFIRPLLFQGNPESIHDAMQRIGQGLQKWPASMALLNQCYAPQLTSRLAQSFFGAAFHHPLGLAAGFDKHITLLPTIRALGMAYAEVGSISARSWQGNPKPRVFRLPQDKAIINRMGLNNPGVLALLPRIKSFPSDWPVGISLVKTPDPSILEQDAIEDYADVLRGVYGYGTYISLNISCPNTEEGKTFEDPEALDALLTQLRIVEAHCEAELQIPPRPWLLKVSPDLDPNLVDTLFDIGIKHQVAGWIATNTTSQRPSTLKTSPSYIQAIGRGGLSGLPLQEASTRLLGQLYQRSQHVQHPQVLIGVGGIHDTESAWDKIIHGANLLQLYTGLIYEGPGVIRRIVQGLEKKLDENQLPHIHAAVGLAYR